jgi:hypothetical protein
VEDIEVAPPKDETRERRELAEQVFLSFISINYVKLSLKLRPFLTINMKSESRLM